MLKTVTVAESSAAIGSQGLAGAVILLLLHLLPDFFPFLHTKVHEWFLQSNANSK